MDFTTNHGQASFCWLCSHAFYGRGSGRLATYATTPLTATAFIDYLRNELVPSDKDQVQRLHDCLEAV